MTDWMWVVKKVYLGVTEGYRRTGGGRAWDTKGAFLLSLPFCLPLEFTDV